MSLLLKIVPSLVEISNFWRRNGNTGSIHACMCSKPFRGALIHTLSNLSCHYFFPRLSGAAYGALISLINHRKWSDQLVVYPRQASLNWGPGCRCPWFFSLAVIPAPKEIFSFNFSSFAYATGCPSARRWFLSSRLLFPSPLKKCSKSAMGVSTWIFSLLTSAVPAVALSATPTFGSK